MIWNSPLPMGQFVRHLLVGGLACLVSALSLADIRTTPHALVKSTKADGSDVCVFCHTPNVSGAPPEKAPLWQPAIGLDKVYVIYDDIGRLGLGKASVGSQSVACLSCHDANQAQAVSKDSNSDHPFGVPYRGATKGNPAAAQQRSDLSTTDAPFVTARYLYSSEDFRDASQGVVEDRTVWWVSTDGVSNRRTRNDLPLYSRTTSENDTILPFVECSSCHDPHSNNVTFLRIPNTGSKLCLSCHIK